MPASFVIAARFQKYGADENEILRVESEPFGLRQALGGEAAMQVALQLLGLVHPNDMHLRGGFTHA